MEILTGQEMRNVDRRTIDELGIPSLTLMEAAGEAVARALLADHPDAAERGVLIVCGKGNNGGDGLVVARHLARADVVPEVVLLADDDALSGDAAHNLRAAREAGLRIRRATDEEAWQRVVNETAGCGIVLDAVLGTGIKGGARGLARAVIEDLNDSKRTLLAVDLPSGLDADSGAVAGVAIRARHTYTLCRPKRALVLPPAADHSDGWSVLDIGIPDATVAAERPALEWVDEAVAAPLVPRRSPGAHKGDFGHLLAVAGSPGKAGAAVLLARGALRAGVGLLTVAAPASVRAEIAVQQAEMMTEALAESAAGGLAAGTAGRIAAWCRDRDALALGPGLGVADSTVQAVRDVVSTRTLPVVLDADGLNAFAGAPELLLRGSNAPALVLTPHPGEAARLLQCKVTEIEADRLAAARDLAHRTGAWIVLKGRHTVLAAPDGRMALNGTGNPGMATAGSGDVLTGILGALLAGGLPVWDAVRLGVWTHGRAGDLAAARLGQASLIASDLVDGLPGALAGLNPR